MAFRNADDVCICMFHDSNRISEIVSTKQQLIHIHERIQLHILHSRCDESCSVDDDIRQSEDCSAKQATNKSEHDHLLVRTTGTVRSVLCVLSGDVTEKMSD